MTQLVLAFMTGLIIGAVTVLYAVAMVIAGRRKNEKS